mgnify:CR=1 FL=1
MTEQLNSIDLLERKITDCGAEVLAEVDATIANMTN